MDSSKLETFQVVCKEKSFTRAAEKLFITPAAVKKQIDALEAEVGTKLIYRSPSGCTLTASGKIFHEQAKKILKLIDSSIEQAQQAQEAQTQELRIGHSVKLSYSFISDITSHYADSLPDSLVRFERLKKSELHTALQKQIIDCFLYINPHKNDFQGVKNELIGTTCIHAVMRNKHPLSEKRIIAMPDLLPYEIYLSAVLDQELYNLLDARIGINLHILDKEDRNNLIISQQRNGIFLYPCPAMHDISIPFDYPPMDIRLYYIRKVPALDSFVQHLRRLLETDKNRVIM